MYFPFSQFIIYQQPPLSFLRLTADNLLGCLCVVFFLSTKLIGVGYLIPGFVYIVSCTNGVVFPSRRDLLRDTFLRLFAIPLPCFHAIFCAGSRRILFASRCRLFWRFFRCRSSYSDFFWLGLTVYRINGLSHPKSDCDSEWFWEF